MNVLQVPYRATDYELDLYPVFPMDIRELKRAFPFLRQRLITLVPEPLQEEGSLSRKVRLKRTQVPRNRAVILDTA
jgi:hypothetical protein